MIYPIGSNIHVVVERIKSSVIIPETVDVQEEVITVAAIGPDVTKVAVGDRIIAQSGCGHRAVINDKSEVFIRESDLIAVVGEAKKG